MAKKTVVLGNQRITGEVVGFKTDAEPWGVYQLEDGTKLKMRVVVSEVVRVDGTYTEEGDPVYVVRSTNVVATEVPDALRRDADRSRGGAVQ